MSHRAKGRELYFAKYIAPVAGPRAYIEAMRVSPYRQHQNAVEGLKRMVNDFEQHENTQTFRELLGMQREEAVVAT